MDEQTINKPQNNIIVDTGEVMKNLSEEERRLLKLLRHAIRSERHTGYKAISKIISNILGILKDPEL